MMSVCLSETWVDQNHIGWKSWKRTLSLPRLLLVAQRPSTYSQGNMGKFWGDYRSEVGWEKVACWSTKAAMSLKRVQIEEKLLWRAYRKSPTLFPTVPFPNPCGLLFPKIGVRTHPKIQSLLSQERVKIRISNVASTFRGSIGTKTHEILKKRDRGRIQGLPNFFSGTL